MKRKGKLFGYGSVNEFVRLSVERDGVHGVGAGRARLFTPARRSSSRLHAGGAPDDLVSAVHLFLRHRQKGLAAASMTNQKLQPKAPTR